MNFLLHLSKGVKKGLQKLFGEKSSYLIILKKNK